MKFTCRCGTEAETASNKKPRGWQGKGADAICPKCRKRHFEIRAVRFSVAEIAGITGEAKTAFYAELKRHHHLVTIAANALLEECRRADVYATEETFEGKLPKFKIPPSPNGSWAYRIVRKTCPSLNSGCAASLSQSVVASYVKQRQWGRWTYTRNALSFKYPCPLVIRAQEAQYSVRIVQVPLIRDGQPVADKATGKPVTQPAMFISLPLGDTRYDFRLWKEPGYDPNFEAFKHLVAGDYELRAVEIGWARIKNRADTDSPTGMIQNYRDGAKNKRSKKLQLKLVIQRPKAAPRSDASGTMVVRTDRDSFILASVSAGRLWRLTEDRLKRHVASVKVLHERIDRYRRERLALSDDKKFRRRKSELRKKIDARLKTKELNHANWLKNWIENAVAEITDYAVRSKVARVDYDDREKSFLPSFQWYNFKQKLSDSLTNAGIAFVELNPDDSEPNGEKSIQRSSKGKSATGNAAGTAKRKGTAGSSDSDK